MDESRNTVTVEELQPYCTLLERSCVSEGRVTQGDIDRRRPGGPEYPDTSAMRWVEYAMWLGVRRGGNIGTPEATRAQFDLSPEEALSGMVLSKPVRVRLELDRFDKIPDAEKKYPKGKTVFVHPKSARVREWLDSCEAQLQRYEYAARQAATLEDGSDDRVLALTPLIRCLAIGLWAWIITTPGSGMPFSINGDSEVFPPDELSLLTERDILRLRLAQKRTEVDRPRIVIQAYGGNDGDISRLPIDGMLAVFAKNQQSGPPEDVLDRWSLCAIIGESVSESFLHREARASAERKAKVPR